MTIRVTQLRLNSNPKFADLTQLRLNSKPKFTNLTQLWLNSFESELSQSWLTTHHILPNLAKSCWPGGGVGCSRMLLNVGSFSVRLQINAKYCCFPFRKICDSTLTQAVSSWLNSDSNDDQHDSTLTRLISSLLRPTQLWLDSFESESSQIWLTTHESRTTLLEWPKCRGKTYNLRYFYG